jgi:Serine kinase of the HPr protein, regulates carbohydrate metabolism
MSLIPIDEFVKELDLEIIYRGNISELEFRTSDINRPGLQLANYFGYFATDFATDTAARLQLIGKIEMAYLDTLKPEERLKRLDKFFNYPLPCVILSRDMQPHEEMIAVAQKYGRPLFRTRLITTRFIHIAVDYLDSKLAPCITQHGELVDVYGLGVLIIGESGIGKSETALELVKMGNRLVSDDVVVIKRVADNRLIGEAPEIGRYFMEIRGIGIIDVKAMYGVGAVINNKAIDLVIQLEFWDKNTAYDRLGMDQDYMTILDVKLPKIIVPVRPGRNLAAITEIAARNFRLKNMGYNAPYELDRRIIEQGQRNNKAD